MLKQALIFLLPLILHVSCANSVEGTACIGNIQDAPITNFKNTPLKGWSAFALSPVNSLYGVNHAKLYEKVALLHKYQYAA